MSHDHQEKGPYERAADKTAEVYGIARWVAGLVLLVGGVALIIVGFQRWPIVTGSVVYVIALPVYLFLVVVIGGRGRMVFGEPNRWVLWFVWWPLYGPYRIVSRIRGRAWYE